MRRIFLLLVLLGMLATAFLLFSPYGPHRETFVEIAPGTSSRQIARALEQQGIVRSRYGFDVWRLWMEVAHGGTLKAGEYRFDHPARISEVYDRIRRGDVYTIALTIPEGSNLFDIAARVEAAQLGFKEAFEQAARKNIALVADLDPHATSLEGYLFPDTYHFGRQTTAAVMVAAMVKRFRSAAASLGLEGNVHRVVTLASLVERETPIAEERPLVASVFINRLDKNMPLMTDPSVIYAALLEGRYRGTIYQSDLNADSPYNTYRRAGLPPGPICNPGVTSLMAAINPAKTNYLYFVAASADPSGHSRFAATLEEHQRNVEAYRRAQHEAGSR
ncbi:protein YceG like [Acidisarcina polymorpha]|uniref:Endolytic murein transglycosylase n=1 Tax=Acidisarcina polymorpha TaxID=2211140 RepID=A0A2Z5G281_9BACT|nr:endolytic transglycosylase MltG [Acidisarcina polymorpha]AXC13192.1 protein YceG like [Acidisarcina polymorpha]